MRPRILEEQGLVGTELDLIGGICILKKHDGPHPLQGQWQRVVEVTLPKANNESLR